MPSILYVRREPCVQLQLVQVLGDRVVLNQDLKRLARPADGILYLWSTAGRGWSHKLLKPGHVTKAQVG